MQQPKNEDLYYVDTDEGRVTFVTNCEPRFPEATSLGLLPDTFYVHPFDVTARIDHGVFRDRRKAYDALLTHLNNQLVVLQETIKRVEKERVQ